MKKFLKVFYRFSESFLPKFPKILKKFCINISKHYYETLNYFAAFTYSCSCVTSPLAQTFVCLCLCAKELFSHTYEHVNVCTHNTNRHSSLLTRVRKTASRASATNKQKNLHQVALLSTFYKGDHGGLVIQ